MDIDSKGRGDTNNGGMAFVRSLFAFMPCNKRTAGVLYSRVLRLLMA